LPYCLFAAIDYKRFKLHHCKDLGNPLESRLVKLDKVFGTFQLPILHSLQIGLTCQRRRIDQASDRICDRKVTTNCGLTAKYTDRTNDACQTGRLAKKPRPLAGSPLSNTV
jgi:hypothetical protein